MILSIHPIGAEELFLPLYIVGARTGWIFSEDRFCQLEQLLPGTLREIYKNKIRIPRAGVPAFMEKEFPLLEQEITNMNYFSHVIKIK